MSFKPHHHLSASTSLMDCAPLLPLASIAYGFRSSITKVHHRKVTILRKAYLTLTFAMVVSCQQFHHQSHLFTFLTSMKYKLG